MAGEQGPELGIMTVDELTIFAVGRDRHAGQAVFELARRAPRDAAAVAALGELSRSPQMRGDRVFHMVSQAWAAIIGLLAAETPGARDAAYAAFGDLDPADQKNLLTYLRVDRIQDAHPDPF